MKLPKSSERDTLKNRLTIPILKTILNHILPKSSLPKSSLQRPSQILPTPSLFAFRDHLKSLPTPSLLIPIITQLSFRHQPNIARRITGYTQKDERTVKKAVHRRP